MAHGAEKRSDNLLGNRHLAAILGVKVFGDDVLRLQQAKLPSSSRLQGLDRFIEA